MIAYHFIAFILLLVHALCSSLVDTKSNVSDSFVSSSTGLHTNSTTHLSQLAEAPPDPFMIREPGFRIKLSNYRGRRMSREELADLTVVLFGILDDYEEIQHLDPDDPIPDAILNCQTLAGLEFDLYPTMAKTSPLKIEDAREILDAIVKFNEMYNVDIPEGLRGFDMEYTELLPDLGYKTLGSGTVRKLNKPATTTNIPTS